MKAFFFVLNVLLYLVVKHGEIRWNMNDIFNSNIKFTIFIIMIMIIKKSSDGKNKCDKKKNLTKRLNERVAKNICFVNDEKIMRGRKNAPKLCK